MVHRQVKAVDEILCGAGTSIEGADDEQLQIHALEQLQRLQGVYFVGPSEGFINDHQTKATDMVSGLGQAVLGGDRGRQDGESEPRLLSTGPAARARKVVDL